MAKEPLEQFLDNLVMKLSSSNSQFIKNEDNVMIGENTRGLIELPDESFPRVEVLVLDSGDDGYLDQRIVNSSFNVMCVGHIRRDNANTTRFDMFDAIRFGKEMRRIFYVFNQDRRDGIDVCDGFIQMSGFSKTEYEYELFDKITTVIFKADAEIQLADTYTNQ